MRDVSLTAINSPQTHLQQNLVLAFGLAIAIHILLLTLNFSEIRSVEKNQTSLIVSLQEPPKVDEPVPDLLEPELPAEQPQEVDTLESDADKVSPVTTPEPILSVDANVENDEPKNPRVSINDFSKWYESGQKNNDFDDSATVQRFANSFVDPVIEAEPDINYEEGRLGPMGGGSYNIRKDGVTCEQITMAPLTFDELQYGTSTIIDNCTQDEKMKIDIHRLNK